MTAVFRPRASRSRSCGLLIAATALLVACASASKASEAPTPTLITTPETTTIPAPTTAAPTTTSTTTTTTTTLAPETTTTTIAPTTAVALPAEDQEPVAPPAAGVSEPLTPIGRIEIPAIGVDKTMYEGITLKTLNQGPGHWPGTASPGHLGNTVIAGHRVSHNKDFRNIDRLQPGDEIILSDDTGRYVYRVTGSQVVKPDAVWIVNATPNATATLFACHPPGSTRERIVVFAELVT